MISTVKSRRLMSMQAKKEKEEMDRQNKGSSHNRRMEQSLCHVGKLNVFASFSQSAWKKKLKRSGYVDRRRLQKRLFRTA